MIAMWCILDKFILCHTPFLIILFFFYFRYKLYNSLQKIPCELLEFSLSTRHLFLLLVFLFISAFPESRPNSSRFPATSSAALASAFAFFASKDASSFSAFFKADFFSLRSAFKVSMLAVMDAISAVRKMIDSCFSAI